MILFRKMFSVFYTVKLCIFGYLIFLYIALSLWHNYGSIECMLVCMYVCMRKMYMLIKIINF